MSDFSTYTATITFGDVCENHAGMEKLGVDAAEGYSVLQLLQAKNILEEQGVECELINLLEYLPMELVATTEPAFVLVIRNGVDAFLASEDVAATEEESFASALLTEQLGLEVDTQAWMRGRVVNKKARHNLCFADYSQEPDYEQKKGRIIAWDDVPHLSALRAALAKIGIDGEELTAEGNYYYDISKCGIGFHGDSERKKVVGVRLGAPMRLHYRWFYQSKLVDVEKVAEIWLNHGDMYIMSAKAVGTDWKKRSLLTLRHAAGCDSFLKVQEKWL